MKCCLDEYSWTFNNRQETYPYFQLPFCQGSHSLQHHHETLVKHFKAWILFNQAFLFNIKDEANKVYCKKTLNTQEIDVLRYAVDNQYWYTMFVDNLPVSGIVGRDEDEDKEESEREIDPHFKRLYVYTHKSFSIQYNKDRIISVSLQHAGQMELDYNQPLELTFTYTVVWNPTDISFENRFESLLETDFFEHKYLHLLRTVKRDFTRYDREEGLTDFDRDLGDEYGWKQVHGDVFRQPPRLMMMSALMGTGSQLVILAGVVILYTILGDLYAERATILTATIFCRNLVNHGPTDFPCRVNPIPRPIPEKMWYAEPLVIVAFCGGIPLLPLYFYYVYGFMLLVLFILLVVSAWLIVEYLISSIEFRGSSMALVSVYDMPHPQLVMCNLYAIIISWLRQK
ncbi:Endomembrane protein 70-domain-containing protein [Blakeslea trispora]|nr:Endomembrane protein 70-domain-containing protein [Blakeslea trispora]